MAPAQSEKGSPCTEPAATSRSEERRVGKECRSRWSRYHENKETARICESDTHMAVVETERHGQVLVVRRNRPERFFLSSRRRHTRSLRDWSSDVCSSDLATSVGDEDRVVAEAVGTARCPHEP